MTMAFQSSRHNLQSAMALSNEATMIQGKQNDAPRDAAEYWRRLERSGWLEAAHLPASPAELRAAIEAEFARDPRLAWSALATIVFDAECIYTTGPVGLSYHAQLQQIADDSRAVFCPDQIADVQEGERIVVSFEHGGRSYRFAARLDSDYFDETLITLINQALAESDIHERLMQLPAFDQCIYLAVVSEAIYRKAEELALIPTERIIFE
jgi:hypothetical protein